MGLCSNIDLSQGLSSDQDFISLKSTTGAVEVVPLAKSAIGSFQVILKQFNLDYNVNLLMKISVTVEDRDIPYFA